MGITSRRIAAAQSERAVGPMADMLAERHVGGSSAGVAVSRRTIAGIPAFDRAVDFAASAVAQLTGRVWRGDGPTRVPVTTSWQSRLFRGVPAPGGDWFGFWWTIEASLTARRNAFFWKSKNGAGQVVALTALHPDQVTVYRLGREPVSYQVTFSADYPLPFDVLNFGTLTVGADVVHHIRGRGGLGELVAPSPIQDFRSAFGLAIAKQQHEAAVYRNGAQGGLVVAFPAGVTKQQADAWRDSFDSEHAGTQNAGRTKVVGNGATVAQIGMSQRDAAFIEAVGLSITDMALITGVPAWLLGMQDSTAKPISPEHEMQRWVYTGLTPRLQRIQSSINADPDLFSVAPNADFFAFDTANLVRGDLMTEADIAIRKVQAGIWLPDEARALDSLGELPDGAGQIPQITPVGGAPNAPSVTPAVLPGG